MKFNTLSLFTLSLLVASVRATVKYEISTMQEGLKSRTVPQQQPRIWQAFRGTGQDHTVIRTSRLASYKTAIVTATYPGHEEVEAAKALDEQYYSSIVNGAYSISLKEPRTNESAATIFFRFVGYLAVNNHLVLNQPVAQSTISSWNIKSIREGVYQISTTVPAGDGTMHEMVAVPFSNEDGSIRLVPLRDSGDSEASPGWKFIKTGVEGSPTNIEFFLKHSTGKYASLWRLPEGTISSTPESSIRMGRKGSVSSIFVLHKTE